MAFNYSIETKIDPKTYVIPSSRYAGSKVLHYGEEEIITFETYKKSFRQISDMGQYAEITPPIQFRPDLVAKEVYGSEDFWWVIMEHNGMKDVMEFKAGKIIRLPGNILR